MSSNHRRGLPGAFRFPFLFVLALGLMNAQTKYKLTDLGSAGFNSFGNGINASGQVTGINGLAVSQVQHAFLWNGTSIVDLGTLGGTLSDGTGINASGQVAGTSAVANGNSHAFFWNGSSMVDLGTLGGTSSVGYGVNASGQVSGYSSPAGDGSNHAFLWNGKTMMDLGTLGGSNSWANGINDSGQVTGSSTLPGEGSGHAVLWNGTSITDLGTLGGVILHGDCYQRLRTGCRLWSARERQRSCFLMERHANCCYRHAWWRLRQLGLWHQRLRSSRRVQLFSHRARQQSCVSMERNANDGLEFSSRQFGRMDAHLSQCNQRLRADNRLRRDQWPNPRIFAHAGQPRHF